MLMAMVEERAWVKCHMKGQLVAISLDAHQRGRLTTTSCTPHMSSFLLPSFNSSRTLKARDIGRCHELYVDTVNISAELEEVVGLFQYKIVPISAGAPQELAFVETAHRVIAGRSRAMLIGAPQPSSRLVLGPGG